jgi:3-oxoadipate enol-lactonase
MLDPEVAMPFAENQGTRIYWEEEGHGVPVLLIMGLGWASYLWHRTKPLVAKQYSAITLDNRGVGRSDVPAGPYPISLMASDAVAVLDAAGVDSAHVIGMSMGGMIAQEFALQYPKRVLSLILGCTASGGPHAVQAQPEVLQILTRRSMDPEEAARAINPFIYDANTPLKRIDEDMKIRMQWIPTVDGYMAQLHGIIAWEAYSRISQITAPTLLIHGESDRLIPSANAKLIAERIPGAKLVMIPHASHIFATDQPDVAHQAIFEFLSARVNHHSQVQV